MCDETESSEPLGGSGSKGVRGIEEGYQERLEWGSRRWGRVQGGRDVGIRLITISVSTEHRVWDVPALEVRKLRRTMMGRRRKEETRRAEERKQGEIWEEKMCKKRRDVRSGKQDKRKGNKS